ncbi:MAG: phasin family protein [Mesorhizobium sp.]|nr:phasin family protein [Mesorhizobium sp.]MCO5162643.1 phasin family protein [Mesorhizobium sp.]
MPTRRAMSNVEMPPMPFSAEARNAFSAGLQIQAQALGALLRYQIEGLAFLKKRYEQDAKLVEDLAASGEMKDALDIVSAFAQNAASDYAAEASRVASLGSKLASEAAKQARKDAETIVEDMAALTVA